jgi:hypothetical protein
MKLQNSVKTAIVHDLGFGKTFLHFWYANNRGRGGNNVTIIKSSNKNRSALSKDQKNKLSIIKTSAWRGNVNFSKRVIRLLNYIPENQIKIIKQYS